MNNRNDSEINLKELHQSNEEYMEKALDLIFSNDEIKKLIDVFKITKKEVEDNIFEFIGIKESIESPQVYPYIYQVNRAPSGELVIKTKKSNNDYKMSVRRQTNLWLTDFSDVSLKSVFKLPKNSSFQYEIFKQSSIQRKQIYEQAKLIAKKVISKKPESVLGMYIYSKESSGKTFACHALANYFACENLSTIYIKSEDLLAELISNIKNKDNNSINEIIDRLKKADILIIDNLGEEAYNNWFHNNVLFTILRDRYHDNKKVIISSPLAIRELEIFYRKNIKSEASFKIEKMFELITKNSVEINLK
ncbi:DnaA ATPase domain-containing protein [Mycoplasma sp. Mirounga ES2805-ORL]|uniref:DnaA ATPase domain-containing protein n=1 Tax=Mycoplasma sp. Mirounga ES2805-ORL TaxID=754514 RepID=UPI00197C8001|nr:DnaA/Hda family protein [Mycoplasma sp. Mirounga ES2805-ORL]QSF13481.1 ATP-binding protein [Mycoplasma sp. Mirounga ES2805-ORL]